jgi:biotin operon repressor
MTAPETDTSGTALTTLRGAGVDIDVRKAGRVIVGLCLLALAVLVVVLFVAGVHKNAQINRLRQHGVPVTVTVSGCLGLLGGSGSNPAGYACQGTFTLDGHRYRESIPGNALRPPGTKVRAVAVSGDPPLLSTAHAVATDRASAGVFVVPSILLVILVVLVGALVFRRRRMRSAASPR